MPAFNNPHFTNIVLGSYNNLFVYCALANKTTCNSHINKSNNRN